MSEHDEELDRLNKLAESIDAPLSANPKDKLAVDDSVVGEVEENIAEFIPEVQEEIKATLGNDDAPISEEITADVKDRNIPESNVEKKDERKDPALSNLEAYINLGRGLGVSAGSEDSYDNQAALPIGIDSKHEEVKGLDTVEGKSRIWIKVIQKLEKEMKMNADPASAENVMHKSIHREMVNYVLQNNKDLQKNEESRRYINFLGMKDRLEILSTPVNGDLRSPEESEILENVLLANTRFKNEDKLKINPESLIFYMSSALNNEEISLGDIEDYVSLDVLLKKVDGEDVKLNEEQLKNLRNIETLFREKQKELENHENEEYRKYYEDFKKERNEDGCVLDVEFDDLNYNKAELKKHLYYSFAIDKNGSMKCESEMPENSIKILADWEKRFQEKLLEMSGAVYETREKWDNKIFKKVDESGSPLLGVSLIKRDEYGIPVKTLYNVSLLSKKMNFTSEGERDADSYSLAALNARKNNWKTITLDHGGNYEQAKVFLENSIQALQDVGYPAEDIKVPKKYQFILDKYKNAGAMHGTTLEQEEEAKKKFDDMSTRNQEKQIKNETHINLQKIYDEAAQDEAKALDELKDRVNEVKVDEVIVDVAEEDLENDENSNKLNLSDEESLDEQYGLVDQPDVEPADEYIDYAAYDTREEFIDAVPVAQELEEESLDADDYKTATSNKNEGGDEEQKPNPEQGRPGNGGQGIGRKIG